jgi:soluble lytic murein transglycosylase-like protein
MLFATLGTSALSSRRANGAAPDALVLPATTMAMIRPAATPLRAPRQFHPFIEQAAARHSISASLIDAVMRVESAYNPRAVSRKGAQGLMQLMPDTATRFGVRDAFDPQQNVLGGAKYLSVLLAQFEGDVALACAAYNAGEQTVLRYGGVPPFRETQRYVERIRRILDPQHRTSAAPAVAPPEPTYFYTWRDARGVLNVGQYPPPAGQPYEKHRLR